MEKHTGKRGKTIVFFVVIIIVYFICNQLVSLDNVHYLNEAINSCSHIDMYERQIKWGIFESWLLMYSHEFWMGMKILVKYIEWKTNSFKLYSFDVDEEPLTI